MSNLCGGDGIKRAAGLLAVCVCLLCVPAPAAAAPPAILGTNGTATPELDWRACDPSEVEEPAQLALYECATVAVPLSYRRPSGTTIELALARLPAADPDRRIGSLFWNPGGPGGSGRFAPVFSQELRQRFDLVGFDPRGVAASTPLRCFRSNAEGERLLGQPFPVGMAETQRFIHHAAKASALCGRRGGALLSHMSTGNVARDLELLRRAVGDDGLSYLGFSYGTHIGEVYANLFPTRVRALALDSVIDPLEWTDGREPGDESQPVEFRVGAFEGARDAFATFLRACVASARCAFAEKGVDLRLKFDTLMERLRERPLRLEQPDGGWERITYQHASTFTMGSLTRASNAPVLAETLQRWSVAAERRARRGVTPRDGARRMHASAVAREESYAGYEWGPAVECTDSLNPDNPWVWPSFASLADSIAPHFGSFWVYYSLPCATWPVEDPDRYAGPWDRETASPILLIGSALGDPSTPYDDAQSTEQELGNARLLTLNSYGHGAQVNGNSTCIKDAVDRYLIDQTLPAVGAVCQPDSSPFDPAPAPAAAAAADAGLEGVRGPQPVGPK